MAISVPWKTLLIRAGLSILSAAMLWHHGQGLPEARILAISAAVAGAAGTLLGFLLTAVALLTAVMDRALVANMRKTGHYQRLVRESFVTCGWMLATLVMSVVNMLLAGQPLFVAFCLTIFLSTFSTLQLIEAGVRFTRVFVILK